MGSVPSLSILVFLLDFMGLVHAQDTSLSQYRLSGGDEISIRVYGQEELTLETKLSDTGTISYPLLGEIRVVGKTIGQLESIITQGLKDGYLVNPRVSVSVKEYRQFYVNGQVKKPGGYPYVPGLTVQMAVTIAEGFTERASRKNIFLLREGDQDGQPDAVSLNSPVLPGDIVTVEESFF
ncbi:MAG: polysaccharide export protein [Gammaproteobacteria bacterium]|nr:polysaccharide export protein [Gammaproteobacteria bacterium]